MKDYRIVACKLYDNQGVEIVLTRYNTHNLKYAYYNEDNEWVKSTDYNYEQQLNILWLRLPYQAYKNKFLLNVALDTEEVYTTGVIDVDWSDLPNPTPFSLTMVATIDDNAQGFAPRIVNVNGVNYWFEYSQDYGGLYNTLIPVTSDKVVGSQIEITSTTNTVDITKTTTETGITYDLSVQDFGMDNLSMTTAQTVTDGSILPKYSTLYIDADGNKTVKGKSSNHDFYSGICNSDNWWSLGILNNNAQFYVNIRIYNSEYNGMVYVVKNGYNYHIYTTSKELTNYIYQYHSGVYTRLMVEGNSHVSPIVTIEDYLGNFKPLIKEYTDYGFNEDKLEDMEYFITNVDISSANKDYINITGSTYSQNPDDITITNYNFSQDLTYTLTKTPEDYLSLRFIAETDDTQVTVKVGTISSTCDKLQVAQQAIFTWYDEDNYGWTYSYIEDFNDVVYESGYTDTVKYEHLIRKGDGYVLFDLLDFEDNWTIINNNYEALNTSVTNINGTLEDFHNLLYKHGVKDEEETDPEQYRYVSAVTVNSQTYYPENSVVDLGEIGGGADNAITSNTITNLEKPSEGYGIDQYITWDNVNLDSTGTKGYYWCNVGYNDIKMTVGYNPNANVVNRFQVNDIVTLNEKDVVVLNGTQHGWSSKHETGSTGTVDWEGFDLGTMKVKYNNTTYSADTDNTVDIGISYDVPANALLHKATTDDEYIKIGLGTNAVVELFYEYAYVQLFNQADSVETVSVGDRHDAIYGTSKAQTHTNYRDIYFRRSGTINVYLKVRKGEAILFTSDGTEVKITPSTAQQTYDMLCIDTTVAHAVDGFVLIDGILEDVTTVTEFQNSLDHVVSLNTSLNKDTTITLSTPAFTQTTLHRWAWIKNSNTAKTITVTFADANGNVVRQMQIKPSTKMQTQMTFYGYGTIYGRTNQLAGWLCDNSSAPMQYTLDSTANTLTMTDSDGTEQTLSIKDIKITI